MNSSILGAIDLASEFQTIRQRGFRHLTELCDLMASQGSDKGGPHHNYTIVYDGLFGRFRDKALTIFELGLGTNKAGAPSSMGTKGRPGASLRGWRAYFPAARIYGADIDRDILFAEERIETFWTDQTNPAAIRAMWDEIGDVGLDIIIDDGLHEASANIAFLIESFRRLKPGGIYIIEDLRPPDTPVIRGIAECLSFACDGVVVEALPHRSNDWDNRLAIFQKAENARTPDPEQILAGITGIYEGLRQKLRAPLNEYEGLTRGFEEAQRWVLGELDALDPTLAQGIAASPSDPIDDNNGGTASTERARQLDSADGAALARLFDAINRANKLGMAFHDQAARLLDDRRRLQRAYDEAVVGRDRALRRTGEPDRQSAEETPGPLVSIVLPVFNHAYLVEEAIAAVRAQTYRNWELIVVDDGSTDDLEGRVRRHCDDRRILFLRQPNQKLPAALNHGFAWARGDLLTWTSADNVMLPNQIERLAAELMAHPEAGLVFSDYWAIDEGGAPYENPKWRPHNRAVDMPGLIRLPDQVTVENFHRSADNFIGASFLYRRTVAELIGPYADDAFGGEDYDFWLRLHLATSFRHVAEPLYGNRVHPDTLNARAVELGLLDNIREVLAADRWRLDTLLSEGDLLAADGALRPTAQFRAAILKRCRPVSYRSLVEGGDCQHRERPLVVDIDVPPRLADGPLLEDAAVLLCRSPLAAALIRQQDWARTKRVLVWRGEVDAAVQHAFVQAFAEGATVPAPASVLPRIDAAFRPSRILLMVDRWSSGGLENLVVDLALALAAEGCTVTLAAAEDVTPPAAPALAGSPVRTLAFAGDETAFADFVRRQEIEVVNYHHSRFAAAQARRLGAATIYTMHNCYLWMNAAQRRQLAADLASMDLVTAVSRQVAQFAAAQFGVTPERLVVVPNGLGEEMLSQPRSRPDCAPGMPFTIAVVASLVGHKLQHVAIAAFEEAARDDPDLRLMLIGAGFAPDYRTRVETLIAASPLRERIELTVGLTRAEAVARLAAAQVFLIPSLLEGCSMALLEAAAAGCVCVAADVGNARDLSVPGGSVVLVPSPLGELDDVSDAAFFAAADAELPEHRANMAAALRLVRREYKGLADGATRTRAVLLERHRLERMTRSYLEAYTMTRRGGGTGLGRPA